MSGFQRGAYLPKDSGGALHGERGRRGKLFIESVTVEPFHDDVGDPVRGASGVFDVGDVLVIKMADNLRLPFKQVDHPVVADRHIRLQNFESHRTVYPEVIGVVHGAHAADADERFDPIFVGENSADEMIRVRQRKPLIVLRAYPLPAGITSLAPGTVFYVAPSWAV